MKLAKYSVISVVSRLTQPSSLKPTIYQGPSFMENLNSDRPLESKEDDKFNRYPFAKRIADTIKSRKEEDCLVIGIYGAWGEGKTSVLNFISDELKAIYPNLISLRFNPWRFKDEVTLITGFYEQLSSEIQRSLPIQDQSRLPFLRKIWKNVWRSDKKRLHQSTGQFIGETIGKLSKYAPLLDIAEKVTQVGRNMSAVELEDLKATISKIIIDNKRRLVISIDDIDRLDTDEVHAIFRLVKLNADFSNTVYILSFDDKMVAKMLGKKYGKTDASGSNFLEKIVQVPLRLPKVYSSTLGNYGIELINNVLKGTSIELSEKEGKQFGDLFVMHFQLRISTPRIVLRYANSLNYSLAILKGHVNIVDLMCIEGVRIFYAPYYDFIFQHRDMFLQKYQWGGSRPESEERITFIKHELERLSKGLNKNEKRAIEELLKKMFPNLEGAFRNVVTSDQQRTVWYINKRICSDHYFDRYFTMSLEEGDLSDLEFDEFIKNLDNGMQWNDARTIFSNIISRSKVSNVVTYLRTRPKTFSYYTGRTLCKFLALEADKIEPAGRRGFLYASAYDQTMYFIGDFVSVCSRDNDVIKMLAEIVQETPSIDFASETVRLLSFASNDEDSPRLTRPEQMTIFTILKDRVLNECRNVAVFIAKPEISLRFLDLWGKIISKSEVEEYLNGFLDVDKGLFLAFLKNFVPMYRINGSEELYQGDFGVDQYKFLKGMYNPEILYQKMENVFGKDSLTGQARTFKGGSGQTDGNILLQFGHAYRMQTPSSSIDSNSQP